MRSSRKLMRISVWCCKGGACLVTPQEGPTGSLLRRVEVPSRAIAPDVVLSESDAEVREVDPP